MRIIREESIAFVIDIQERLVPVMSGKTALIEKASILTAGLKELEVPLYITQQYTKGLGKTVEEITDAAGSDAYIEKIRFSAFEEIKEKLADKKYVIVYGIEAHICVLQTVIELSAAGYVPVLVTDCVSSRKEGDLEMALKRAEKEGAILTTYEALLFELLEAAGTKTSRKIQHLIK